MARAAVALPSLWAPLPPHPSPCGRPVSAGPVPASAGSVGVRVVSVGPPGAGGPAGLLGAGGRRRRLRLLPGAPQSVGAAGRGSLRHLPAGQVLRPRGQLPGGHRHGGGTRTGRECSINWPARLTKLGMTSCLILCTMQPNNSHPIRIVFLYGIWAIPGKITNALEPHHLSFR